MSTNFKRVIFVYEKVNESLVREIDISGISERELKEIITCHHNDPHLIMSYTISRDQVNKINTLIENKVSVDLDHFIYQMDTYRIP